MKISCKGDQREFERGTKWSEIARAFSETDGKDVLLVHDLD